jgi:hypothetical protein
MLKVKVSVLREDPKDGRARIFRSARAVVYILAALIAASAMGTARAPATEVGQVPAFALSPTLTIGIEEGDEKLMFGLIVRVDVDGRGNIHILDYKSSRVGVFDNKGNFLRQIAVPEGQGPRETTGLPGLAVTPGGTVFISDTRKVIVYGPDGRYLRTFPVDFTISSIGCPGTEELVVLGPHAGKILHVFDAQGRLAASFGDTFRPPPQFEPMKETAFFGAPNLFNCAKDGRIFVLNPHKYEISVFKDRKLERLIEGRNDAFLPIQKTSFGFASTAAEIVSSGDLIFVALLTRKAKAKLTADVFQAGRQIGSVDFSGIPMADDGRGLIYMAEQPGGLFGVLLEAEGFPKVVRYALTRK